MQLLSVPNDLFPGLLDMFLEFTVKEVGHDYQKQNYLLSQALWLALDIWR